MRRTLRRIVRHRAHGAALCCIVVASLTLAVAPLHAQQTPTFAPLVWRSTAPGVRLAESPLRGEGEASRLKLVVVDIDPQQIRFDVAWGVDANARSTWSLARAPRSALAALNAGQFTAALPWGWVVADGREKLAPGRGPLSMAFIARRDGSVALIDGDTLEHLRRDTSIVAAFQSYPTLLRDGAIPRELSAPCAIDCTHRDARLALGRTADGHLLIAMTRFDAVGETLGFVPFGVNVPEMAGILKTLGARHAVLLDGGISAQLLVRPVQGQPLRWSGIRTVPLALIVHPR